MPKTETDWTYRLYELANEVGGEGVADADYFIDEGGPGPLFTLAGYRAVADEVESSVRAYVVRARKIGHSWDEIGEALGISRQAAHKRFSR